MTSGHKQLIVWRAVVGLLAVALAAALLALTRRYGDDVYPAVKFGVDDAYRRAAAQRQMDAETIRRLYYSVVARGGGEYCVELRARSRRDPSRFGFCYNEGAQAPRSERDSPGVF